MDAMETVRYDADLDSLHILGAERLCQKEKAVETTIEPVIQRLLSGTVRI